MRQNRRGFTIIEVVLVLAIAGLIFLMVFVGLPALRRNQRDAKRRNDIARFMSAVETYKKNNKGDLPFRGDGGTGYIDPNFVLRYIDSSCTIKTIDSNWATFENCGDGMTDPDGSIYRFLYWGDRTNKGNWPSDKYEFRLLFNDGAEINKFRGHCIMIWRGARCDGTDGNYYYTTRKTKDYIMVFITEGEAIYCIDNQ